MMLFLDILITGILIILISLSVKKIKKTKLFILSFYLITFFWGAYIWVKGGLDLDYGTPKEIENNYSWIYYIVGFIIWISSILLGLLKTVMLVLKKLNTTQG
tara:strand:- start:293 stop:598 length:306 start_codon:yes stop_codon:yes gene_type:complete